MFYHINTTTTNNNTTTTNNNNNKTKITNNDIVISITIITFMFVRMGQLKSALHFLLQAPPISSRPINKCIYIYIYIYTSLALSLSLSIYIYIISLLRFVGSKPTGRDIPYWSYIPYINSGLML